MNSLDILLLSHSIPSLRWLEEIHPVDQTQNLQIRKPMTILRRKKKSHCIIIQIHRKMWKCASSYVKNYSTIRHDILIIFTPSLLSLVRVQFPNPNSSPTPGEQEQETYRKTIITPSQILRAQSLIWSLRDIINSCNGFTHLHFRYYVRLLYLLFSYHAVLCHATAWKKPRLNIHYPKYPLHSWSFPQPVSWAWLSSSSFYPPWLLIAG